MNKLETLVVPVDLGGWLKGMILGESCRYFTMIDELFHYWDTMIDSPTGSFIAKNKKELIEVIIGSREYEVEEVPLYYALVKGHELIDTGKVYWDYNKSDGSVFISELYSLPDNFLTEMSKEAWNELGINETNADLIEVGW